MTEPTPGETLAPPPVQPSVTLAPEFCARLAGKSIRDCACRLPNKAGWALCPPSARGLLEPIHDQLGEREHVRAPMPPVLPPRPAHAMPSPTGEFCECGGMYMRTGSCLTCMDCGGSTGGCG